MSMAITKIIITVLSVIVLVVFLALMPTIISSTATAVATSGADTATISILNLIPLMAAVGGIAISGTIATAGAISLVRDIRK